MSANVYANQKSGKLVNYFARFYLPIILEEHMVLNAIKRKTNVKMILFVENTVKPFVWRAETVYATGTINQFCNRSF